MNFTVWGLLHGVMLAIHRAWREFRPLPKSMVAPLWRRAGAWLLTFVLVNLAWAFFCMDVKTAVYFFERLILG
jgi:alginate O-acetyltransferase complex protein AlgI